MSSNSLVKTKCLINKLHDLGYVFKEQLHYQSRYRLKGGTHIIHMPRRDNLDEIYVRSTLKQAGQTSSQIEKFIKDAKA